MPPDTRRQDSPLVAVIRLRPVIPFQYGPRIHNSVPDPRRLLVFGPITLYASMIVCVSGYALTTAIGVSIALVFAESVADVQKILKFANEHKVPVGRWYST